MAHLGDLFKQWIGKKPSKGVHRSKLTSRRDLGVHYQIETSAKWDLTKFWRNKLNLWQLTGLSVSPTICKTELKNKTWISFYSWYLRLVQKGWRLNKELSYSQFIVIVIFELMVNRPEMLTFHDSSFNGKPSRNVNSSSHKF